MEIWYKRSKTEKKLQRKAFKSPSNFQAHKLDNSLFSLNLILTSLAVLTFTFSMLRAMQSELRFNDLGLISSLPSTYFISVFSLIISFILSLHLYQKSKYLLIIQTFELISFLFLMPILLEGTPRFNSSFNVGGEIEYILRNSFLNAELVRYHSWPGAEIFGASFILLTNFGLYTLLSFAPFFLQIIYFIVLFSLFSIVFKDGIKVWISCWIFYISNWLNQDYFSPQNIAFLLYLIILSSFFKLVLDDKHKVENKFNIIFTVFALVATHILTPFILLFNTFSFSLINNTRKLNTKFLSLVFVIFIIYISWEIFGAAHMLPKIVHLLRDALNFELTKEGAVNRISSGSDQHLQVVQFRIYNALLLYFIAFTGLFSTIKQIKNAVPSIMLLLIFSALGLLGAGGYGGEIVIRVVLFSLIPLSYFAAQNFDKKMTKVILIIFLIISPFLHLIGHYGSETIDYTAPDDLKGANFFFAHAPTSSSIKCPSDELSVIKYIENFKLYNSYSSTAKIDSDIKNNYLWLTRRSQEVAVFLDNDPRAYSELVSKLNYNPLYNNIYSSRNFKVFLES